MKQPAFYDALSPEERRLRDRRYPRCSVAPWNDSPFKFLIDSGNDQAMVT